MAFVSTERKPLFPPKAHDNGSAQNGALLPHSHIDLPESSKKAGPLTPPKSPLKAVRTQHGPILPPKSPQAESKVGGAQNGPLFPPKSPKAEPKTDLAQNGPLFPPKSPKAEPKTDLAQNGPLFPPKSPKAEPKTDLAQNGPLFPPKSPKAEPKTDLAQNGPLFPPKSTKVEPKVEDGPLFPPKSPKANGPILPPKSPEADPKSMGGKSDPILSPKSQKSDPISPKSDGAKNGPIFPPLSQKAEETSNDSVGVAKSEGVKNGPLFPPKSPRRWGVQNGPIVPPKSPKAKRTYGRKSESNDESSTSPSSDAFIPLKSPTHDNSSESDYWFMTAPTHQLTPPTELFEENEQPSSDSNFLNNPTVPVKLPSNSSAPIFPPILGTQVYPKSETVIVSQPRKTESPEAAADAEAATFPARRGSVRLIRIEPTMPSKTLSVHSSDSSCLSVLEESGDSSQSNYPCSISPGTLKSMELLFSFSDLNILEKLADSWPIKCTYVIKELIETERTYVRSLTDIIKGYLSPLYSYVLENGESPNFISSVFGNIVKIHQIHTTLLQSMQSASTRPEEFADVFLDCDFLSQYTIYCTNYSKGNKQLEQTFSNESDLKHFIMDCQKKVGHTLPLTSYLIKPVQRILKYPLLLEDLNKKFDWTNHPGQLKLKQALEKMSSVAAQINTAFNDQAKTPGKSSPKAIAQKRFHQLKDLQKSRTMDHRQGSPAHHSITQSNSLPHSYERVSLFPVPKNNSLNRFSHLEEKSSAAARISCICASFERQDSDSSKPRVRDLKSFYEKLTEQTEEEMMRGRRQSGGANLKRTNSMDSSFVEVENPKVSRATSLGNLFKFRSGKNKAEPQPKSESRSLLKRFGRAKKPSK